MVKYITGNVGTWMDKLHVNQQDAISVIQNICQH